MNDEGLRFAGYFALDVRLLVTCLVFAVALATLAVALRLRGRRWDEHVVGFLAVFSLSFLITLGLTNLLAVHPALRIESLFPVP
jgi:predicted Na+-dependent transporter